MISTQDLVDRTLGGGLANIVFTLSSVYRVYIRDWHLSFSSTICHLLAETRPRDLGGLCVWKFAEDLDYLYHNSTLELIIKETLSYQRLVE